MMSAYFYTQTHENINHLLVEKINIIINRYLNAWKILCIYYVLYSDILVIIEYCTHIMIISDKEFFKNT